MNSPFSYAEIAGRYDANPQLSDLGLSVNDYSELGNYFTGSNNFDQGTGNWFTNAAKRFAYEKNQWLDQNARPVLDFTGNVGEKLFSFFGADPATGREVGEGLVGQTVDFLPAIAGYGLAAIPGVGSFSVPIGNALTGAMSGATALEQSDSYGQAGVMAALPFVAPGVSNFGAKAAFEGIAEPLGKTAVGKLLGMGGAEVGGKVVTKSIADKLTAFLGSEVAIGSAVEGASWAVSALEGDPYNPFTKENVLANVLETVMMPFSYAELIHGTEIRDAAVKQVRQEKATDQADAEQLIPVTPGLAPTPQGTLTTSYLSALNEVDSIPDSAMRAKAKHAVEALHQKLREEAAPTDSTIESLFKGEVETVMKEASQVVTDEGEGGVVVDPKDSPVEGEDVKDGNVRYFQGVMTKPDPFKGIVKTELGEGFESREVYLKDKDVYLREVAENGEIATRSYVDKRGNEFYQDYRTDNLWVEGPDAQKFKGPDGKFDQEKLKKNFETQVFPSLSRKLAKLKTLGKPRNLREAQEQVITVNQVREEQNLEPVTDKALQSIILRELEAGATPEEAVQTAISQIKEETKKVASGTGSFRGGRKKKPYSSEEVAAAQTEIDALVTSEDKTLRKLAIEGLKVITKRTELERYMRNATKAVHEFIQAYQKNQELGVDPSKLAELNGLSRNELQAAGYLTSRGELVLKDEDALVAWNRLKFTLERLSERFDVPTTTLAKDDGTKAFDSREEAEKFAMKFADQGARVAQAGGKKKVDGSRGDAKWYVRVPQKDSQVDLNTVAGRQAVEVANKVFAQDPVVIDKKDKAVADEVRDDRLEELLRIAENELADDKTYNAELVRELAQTSPETAKMLLEARLAELDAEDVRGMFNQSADWAVASQNYMVDFPANVERKIPTPAKNNGLHTSIGDVLGVSTDGKETLYIGNKSIQKNVVNGHIDEALLVARLTDAGLSKGVWEAYKLAYPKMAENGKVNLWWLEEAGKKGLVEVDVHGGRSHYEVANQRMGEIRHEFDTKYREFDFSDVRAVAIEGYVYGNDALTDRIKKFLDSNPEVIDLAREFDALLKSSYAAANGQSDFAQQYGSIAPDDFEPFDPTTGLGNVAYELRAPGVKSGGQHTGNEDTLAWVRGKFVEKDGKKVFRVDEVQSDAAQQVHKLVKQKQEYLTQLEPKLNKYTELVKENPESDFYKSNLANIKEEVARAQSDIASFQHPLFDSYESLALRVAIEKARENGAEEIFLPDGETAMMSEGHDKIVTEQITIRPTPEAIASVKAHAEKNGRKSNTEYIDRLLNGETVQSSQPTIGNWAEAHGFIVERSGPQVTQSKGMTDAYDRRLPQTTSKLLGEKGEKTVLGTHKNGPSPVFKDGESGKSTTTGLTYSLAGKGFDESGAGQFTITPSLPALMERMLIKAGFTQEQVTIVKPFFEALSKTLNLDDVKFGELLTEAKKGSATIDGNLRLMLLSSKDLQGLSLEEATQQLSLVAGHEIGHLTEHLYRKNMLDDVQSKAFKDAVDWTTKASAEEKQLAFEVLRDGTLPESMRNHPILAEMQRSFDKPEEFRAHLMSIWAMGQTFKSPDQQFAFGLLPKPVARFFKLLTDMAWKMYGSVRSVLHNAPGFGTWDARHRAWKLKEMMTSLRDAQWKNEVVMKDFEGIGMVGPEARASFEGRAKDLYGQSRTLDEFMRFFDPEDDQKSVIPEPRNALLKQAERLFVQGDQLAAAVPELKNVFNALHSFTANTKAMTKRAAGKLTGGVDASGNPYWTRDGQMSWERVQLDKHPRNNKLLSDWMRLQQSTVSEVFDPTTGETKQIRGAGIELDKLSKHDRALADKINQLPKVDRDAIVDMRNRFTEFMSQLQTDTLTHFKESVTTTIAGYLAMRMPESYGDVHKIANSLFTATLRIRSGDTINGQALMNQAASMFKDSTVFNNAIDISTRGYNNWMKLTQFFAERPWFFSEIRNGNVLLKWTEKDGTSGSLGFKDRKDAQAYEKQLIDRGIPRSQISAPELTRGQAHFEVEPEWLTAVAQMEVEAKQQIDNMSDLTPEQKELLKSEHAYAAEFQRAFASHEVFKPGSNRKLSAGREDLDMVSTQIAYANAASRAINRKVLTQALIHAYANPKLKDPVLADWVAQSKQIVKNFMVADTELGRAISTTNAAYFLGLNMSSHIVELGQGAFTFVPEMVNQGMGYFESNVAMFKAQMQVAKFYAKHLPKKAGQVVGMNVKDDNKIWNNPDIEDLMNWAATRDLVSLTHVSDIVDVDVSSTADLTTLAVKGPKGLVKKAFSPIKAFANTSLKLYQQFTEFNARTALLLGYQMGKKKGMTHVEAREHAAEFARRVTFSGGKANRPEMLFSNEGSFRTAGQAAYSLQGYTFGVLSMMWRYAQTGYNKKQFPNMSEAERAHARKALKTMVATQFAGAGLLGMPFVGPAMAMVEEFSDAEPFMDIRLALAELFNEDDEEGGLLSDIVMYGAANAFANKLLPGAPDFQSRYALGTVMGLNPYTGFSLDQLAGPTGSIVRNIGAGLKALTVEGDFERAVGEWAPVSFKKYLDLQRNDGELTDARTNTRIEANGEEKFLYAIGFTPQRIRKMKDVASAQYRHEEVQTRKDVRWHDDIADLYLRDPRAAAAKIRQRAIEDDAFSAQAAMNKVAERVEKRTFAMDPRRESSKKGSDGMDALMRSMGVTSEASEMDRLNLKQQVMQSLGGVQPPSQTAYRRAMMVDQLMQSNPYMTRAQALMQVDLQLSRRA